MSIPETIHPTFPIVQPSTKKELWFRRYLVKEEKILLLAKESKEINIILKAIKDVVKICCQELDFNVNEIPLFDLEYIFLKLRASSVNNIEKITVIDVQDKLNYDLIVNFDEIQVNFKENAPSKNIKIDDKLTLVMRYPKASIYDDNDFKNRLLNEGLFELVIKCVENIYNVDEQIQFTPEELRNFVDNLDIKTFKKIEEFLLSTPSIKYTLIYKNSLGNEQNLTFNSLLDFFLYV